MSLNVSLAAAILPAHRPAIRAWLGVCLLLIIAMVWVGGLTRLTESGLSIVEWAPVSGVLPPLSDAAWAEELEKYRASPQYQQINRGMSVEEFKQIFWLEYWHRVLGRVIGLVFFVPWLYFSLRRALPRRVSVAYFGIFALGGLQGVIGWYMVKSGLVQDPQVSPYRLALHLGTAVVLFSLILWQYLSLRAVMNPVPALDERKLWRFAHWLVMLVFLQIILGAFMAGSDAWRLFKTYPLMEGRWIPEDMWVLAPLWRNLDENLATVQFNHRIGAKILAILVVLFAWRAWRVAVLRPYALALLALYFLQFALGVAALLYLQPFRFGDAWWPILLASAHQVNALLLLGVLIALQHRLQPPRLSPSTPL